MGGGEGSRGELEGDTPPREGVTAAAIFKGLVLGRLRFLDVYCDSSAADPFPLVDSARRLLRR